MMTVAEIMKKMIEYSNGNRHDINHFMKVHSYARMIGKNEGLTEERQETLEIAAIVHDIACPLCREKYGNTNGKKQEEEGMPLTREFLREAGLPESMLERIVFLVGHHHTVDLVDGEDYQILLEADYLVNADESGYSEKNLCFAREHIFKTRSGSEVLEAIYF